MNVQNLSHVHNTANKNTIFIQGLLWVVMFAFCLSEVEAIWSTAKGLDGLSSVSGKVAFIVYIILLFGGLILTGLVFWRSSLLKKGSRNFQRSSFTPITLVGGILIAYTYIFLFSPWQQTLTAPWLGLLFSVSLVQIILFLLVPDREPIFNWGELALTLLFFSYPRVVQEVRSLLPSAFQYRLVTILGLMFIFSAVFALYSKHGQMLYRSLLTWRSKLGRARIVLILLLCVLPIIYRFLVSADIYIFNDDIRFTVLLMAVWGAAYLAAEGTEHLVTYETLGLGLGGVVLASFVAMSSLMVTNYPFSLSWSEGNRFYDYSIMFGQSIYRYDGQIINPYFTPGRYGLWGILFLWQGLPIWVHRLWDLFLTTVPVLLFAFLLTRKLTSITMRSGLFLWISLFLMIPAPLHPPIMVAMVVMLLFALSPSLPPRLLFIVLAGYYVSISRFTWTFAPAAVGMLIELLLFYPTRQGPWWRRLLPALLIAVIGSLPGLIRNSDAIQANLQAVISRPLPGDDVAQSVETVKPIASQQALLWERLLPNSTLSMGVLFLILMYTLPLIVILIWWMVSKRWKLDLLQKIVVWVILIAFFLVGLVISTKIGGGGDLHNLDMYLLTLFTVFVMGVMSIEKESRDNWPAWAICLVIYSIGLLFYPLTPFNPGSRTHPSVELASQKEINKSLSAIQKDVQEYARLGDILFMDQRQLLTFGYVSGINLVPEYEKKYMMDQAMSNNADYFHDYYEDLAHKRFSLIITEPLHVNIKSGTDGSFTDENDAWVQWVSMPTLCYYEPIYTSKNPRVQLLIPKEAPVDCDQFLK